MRYKQVSVFTADSLIFIENVKQTSYINNKTISLYLDLQDILRCLLAKHPSYRPTLEEVIQHPWLQQRRHRHRPSLDRRSCQSAPIPAEGPQERRERRLQRGNSLL